MLETNNPAYCPTWTVAPDAYPQSRHPAAEYLEHAFDAVVASSNRVDANDLPELRAVERSLAALMRKYASE